jgi:outer membrane protein OmpA-like peptidoglycan-associated protein
MRTFMPACLLAAIVLFCVPSFAVVNLEKQHDYLPRFHNIIFVLDVSDSMIHGYPEAYDVPKIFIADRALQMFDAMMPHVPRWQYDINAALITYGDNPAPRLLKPLGVWARGMFKPYYGRLRLSNGPFVTAAMPQGLQLAGQLIQASSGRTAVVIISDGGSFGECPQCTASALKKEFGEKVQVFGIFLGSMEVGWRNLYEACKLTGGYARHWEEVRTKDQMRDFAWDVLVREIMFPYPEIFFQEKSADLLPSEALKLEAVANFLKAVPQYTLQIDGHTTFIGNTADNYKLGMARATTVRDSLIKMYCIDASRVQIRSWGEELPRYDNTNPDLAQRNREANMYLMLPLRNFPYDEKRLHTFGVPAIGDLYNTQERDQDIEWAWPAKPVPPVPSPPIPPAPLSARPPARGR